MNYFFRVNDKLWKRFKQYAKQEKITMSKLLIKLITEAMESKTIPIEKINSEKEETPIKKDGERILVDGKHTRKELDKICGL